MPTKTRLRDSSLDNDEIYSLSVAFLSDTIKLSLLSSTKEILLASDPLTSPREVHRLLSELAYPPSLESLEKLKYQKQIDGNFGQRIQFIVEQAQTSLVFLGSDCPMLSPEIISCALELTNRGNLVLGPTPEGGVYLIGVPLIMKNIDFQDVFSIKHETELESLINLAKKNNTSVSLLPINFDVDLPEDLVTLNAQLKSWHAIEFNSTDYPIGTPFHAPTTNSIMQSLSLVPVRNERRYLMKKL